MTNLVKLNEGHLEEIYRRSAIGEKPAEIAKELEAGLVNEVGDRLLPVTVTRSNVRYHANTKAGLAEVERWRVELYGDVLQFQEAWPAWRLGELGKLYRVAAEGLEAATTAENGPAARAWVKQAGELLERMHRHCESVRPTTPAEGAKHLHLHGSRPVEQQEYGKLVSELAGRLLELSNAGLLEGRLAPMLPNGDGADAVDPEKGPADTA